MKVLHTELLESEERSRVLVQEEVLLLFLPNAFSFQRTKAKNDIDHLTESFNAKLKSLEENMTRQVQESVQAEMMKVKGD